MNTINTKKNSTKKSSTKKSSLKKTVLTTLTAASLTVGFAQARDSYDHIRFGVDVPYEPMEYRTPEGELTGFDIDLGNALCEQMEVTCEWVEQQWDGKSVV